MENCGGEIALFAVIPGRGESRDDRFGGAYICFDEADFGSFARGKVLSCWRSDVYDANSPGVFASFQEL